MLDDRRPRGIELMRRRRRPATGNPVRLLDEHDAQADRLRGARRREEILRLHTAACAMTEDERSTRVVRALDVRLRDAERRVDLERLHGTMLPCRLNPGGAAP
jgi:hypothetical protein